MNGYKEFQGKNLDEAIEAACDYFNLKRDKLEIEILGGGSTGIFGLMGVKKAAIKARPSNFKALAEVEDQAQDKGPSAPEAAEGPREQRKPEQRQAREQRRPEQIQARDKAPERPAQKTPERAPKPEQRQPEPEQRQAREQRQPEQRQARDKAPERPAQKAPERAPRPAQRPVEAPLDLSEENEENGSEGQADTLAGLDKEALVRTVREVTENLLRPIIAEPKVEIALDTDRVKVVIDDEEHSGLIIGREGQTLAALQYLVNRLVTRKMQASIRVQLDSGDYRERQDERLRQMARDLAEKCVAQDRTQSTRPMSSYHRRVVHLALQNSESVFTRSKGEGPMKRVLIVPKRKNWNKPDQD
ncbi:MAG: Jag N-terminal domain-containing protein [Desulfovibrionaceae bacterium]|nr:Jag N-terminal domain-containing protein [Desulfovibrionaceae bacterium]